MRKAGCICVLCSVPLLAGEFSTFIGQTTPFLNPYPIGVIAITADAAGNTYLTGYRTLSGPEAPNIPPIDCFVSKVDPAGNLVFTDAFAGQGRDESLAIAVDPLGNIYVGGTTTSPDFPLSNALQTAPPSSSDVHVGFLMKLSPDGRTILYSTYFGGTQGDTTVLGLTTDSSGNLYVTGTTGALDFPQTAGMPAAAGVTSSYTAAFITEISAAGDRILYSGDGIVPLVGNPFQGALQSGVGVAVGSSGNAYVVGYGGALGTGDVFAVKVNAGGKGLAWSKVLTSAASYDVRGIALDAAGDLYAAGATSDANLPGTAGTVGPHPASSNAGFMVKFRADGSDVLWSTYLGDRISSIAADKTGDLFAVGTTTSPQFPNSNGWSATGQDFLAELDPSGTKLLYAGRYPNGTISSGIALDASGLVHAAGPTGLVSAIAPAGAPLMRPFGFMNAAGEPMTGNLAPGEIIAIYGPHIGPATPVVAQADSSGMLPTTLGGVEVKIGGLAVPLLYVSDGQINAIVQLPVSNTTSLEQDLQIVNGNTTSPGFRTVNVSSSPEVFADAEGNAIAVNSDGMLNSTSRPAKAGTSVAIWVSGLTALSPVGRIATAANNYAGSSALVVLNPQASPAEWITATVQYAGTAPGTANALLQINFVVPPVAQNQRQLSFAVGYHGSAAISAPVQIYVTP